MKTPKQLAIELSAEGFGWIHHEYLVDMINRIRAESDMACVSRTAASDDGKMFCVYLKDGTKIVVGRDKSTKGPAWLEIKPQAKIVPTQVNSPLAPSALG